MSSVRIPEDREAERMVLAAAVWRPGVIGELIELLSPEDFYAPLHQAIFASAIELYREGIEVNAVTVGERLALGKGYRTTDVIELASVEWYGWRSAADRLVRLYRRRRLQGIGHEILMGVGDESVEIETLVDTAVSALGELDALVTEAVPDGLTDVDSMAAKPKVRAEWLIPGLLRDGWRAMLVAPEGVGKSVVSRAIGILAAQGIHPFRSSFRFEPIRTLLVDLENPDDVIYDTAYPLVRAARVEVGTDYQPGRAWIWSRPAGIDLRRRAWQRQLEAVLAWTKPDLVCMGPLYKAGRKIRGESDEDVAADLQAVLDDLRTRYRFGLILEHHAPKAQQGHRVLDPFGSSLWMRWPEIGLRLAPTDPEDLTHLKFDRFRGDRGETQWPTYIARGGKFLWTATYAGPEDQ